MNYSTHYNLNLAEGTDLVNPLTVDVPNYTAIDSAMFANEQAGVGSATELKSGTIHAITRGNTNRSVFRFKSTSVFNTGDTFTVDGNVVTALYVDGSSLKDRCFIVGSDVLCLLDGAQLTVLATYVQNASEVPFDNTNTDLTSVNVENAIIETYNTAKGILTTDLYTEEIELAESETINANSSKSVYVPITKAGYSPIALVGLSTGSIDVFAFYFRLYNANNARLDLRNVSNAAVSVKPRVMMLYHKA